MTTLSARRSSWSVLSTILILLSGVVVSETESLAGAALRLYYDQIPGDMKTLKNAPSFPESPSRQEPITAAFEKLEPSGVDYGTLTRGFLEAPLTGNYRFWLASDDESVLNLSTNDAAAGLRKVVENRHYTRPRQYEARPDQRSQPIPLIQGQKYYFELLHKQGPGGDHISVAWQMPDGQTEKPISAAHLMPVPVENQTWHVLEKQAPVILDEYWGAPVALSNATVKVGESATFAVTVEAAPPASLQWFRDGRPVPGANLSTFTIDPVGLSNDVDVISVVASNKFGVATSRCVAISVVPEAPPAPTSALLLGDGSIMAVFFSDPMESGSATKIENYLLDHGARVRNAQMGASPNIVLLATSIRPGNSRYTLTVSGLKTTVGSCSRMEHPVSLQVEDGLQTWLKFDDAADATTAKDSSGNHNDASLAEGALIADDGRIGRCLRLNGNKAHAVLPEGYSEFTNGMTICLWGKCAAKKNWARFVEFATGPDTDRIALSRVVATDHVMFVVQNDARPAPNVLVQDCLADAWVHFAVTLDPEGNGTIYLDGKSFAQGRLNVPGVFKRTANYIGRSNQPSDEFFAGDIDDFRVYTRPLSRAEINILVAAGYK